MSDNVNVSNGIKGSKGANTKEFLIQVASKLFLENGYSNTGINDILTEAKISKGSFYFYFSSKKQLACEVANYYRRVLLEDWLKPLSNNTWNVFINKMVIDIKKSIALGNYYGCPIATLGAEIAFIEDDLSNVYAAGIKLLIDIFSNSLQLSGMIKEKADIMARKAFAIYEGHILYYRISKDESSFDFMLKDLLEIGLVI